MLLPWPLYHVAASSGLLLLYERGEAKEGTGGRRKEEERKEEGPVNHHSCEAGCTGIALKHEEDAHFFAAATKAVVLSCHILLSDTSPHL